MTANSRFEFLPSIALDIILDHLDLDSIKSLRLTNKTVSRQCIGPRFKSFFKKQTTDLTKGSLQSLSDLASHPAFGPAVKDLTITAVICDLSVLQEIVRSKEKRQSQQQGVFSMSTIRKCSQAELEQAQSDLDWLQNEDKQRSIPAETAIQSLTSIFRHRKSFDSIDLDATVLQGPNERVTTSESEWNANWMRASQVYAITMSAIARSNIAVDTLTIFRCTPRCSVASCDITSHMATPDMQASSALSIREFALSLSTKVETDFHRFMQEASQTENDRPALHASGRRRQFLNAAEDPQAVSEDNFPGAARLLKLMPKLEALDLHLCPTVHGDRSSYARIFKDVADLHFPALQQVFLRGLYVSEDSLLKFLSKHPKIDDLHLGGVHLTSGSWKTIFAYLGENMPALKRLYVSSIYANNKLVNLISIHGTDQFDNINYKNYAHPNYFSAVPQAIVHTAVFDEERIKKGFELDDRKPAEGEWFGSPGLAMWQQMYRANYGCP
ncbi:hypothetical protein ASPWEDRAFT_122152 [Aspergillus wentii DTO 134E9]|uniref:F-box domain-containing protein n=1 Tax=Aspergillus wentii DTO 134E9 TaxID=1073089 RepID=A0A1L9R4W2_ASPWE|nr:uncharacterized protein ASPWEDRAFT_122152 [Aspergillus wentii DTO 134E9]KAI9927231.1 hypothetical protein MW887_003617 [Aspergillus wentii]OJJ29956.1 hypothetical protein ASPWEDRAFT_122152 [Aspergillus wentii DTO 134E9]